MLVLACVLLAGCGKKGPPRPPLAPVTAEPPSAVARQAGDRLEVLFSLPDRRLDGTPVERLSGVRVYRLSRPLPAGDGGAPPATARSAFTERLPPVLELGPEEAAALPPGGNWLWGEPIAAAVAPEDPAVPRIVSYSARFQVRGRRWSPPVQPVTLVTAAALPAPGGLVAQATDEGVRLAWQAAAEDLGAGVFRADAGQPVAFRPLASLPAGSSVFVDTGAAVGRSYVYEVRSASGAGRQTRYSAAAGPAAVTMEDRFPPGPPTSLTVLERPGGVQLFWAPSDAPDLAGYRVWRRRLPDGDWLPLQQEALLGTSFSDLDVEPGAEYQYAVTALDGSEPPNESSRCEPAAARVPASLPPAQPQPEAPGAEPRP